MAFTIRRDWHLLTFLQDPDTFEREYVAAVQHETAATKPKRGKKTVARDSEDEDAEAVDDHFTTVGKGGKAMQFTPDAIFKTLQLVQEARGKKVCIICDYLTPLLIWPCRTPIGLNKSKYLKNYWKLLSHHTSAFASSLLSFHPASTTIRLSRHTCQ
jgi:hypothetical protein